MDVDKQNGNVGFNEKEHVYFNLDNENVRYISVTTLIGKYIPPYDSEFWSAYKALERLIPKDSWKTESKALRDTRKIDKSLFAIYDIDENEFNKVQQDILDEWEKINRESCERGTKIHAMLENTFYKAGKNVSLQKFGIGGKFECRKDYTDLNLEYGVYPEYLLFRESKDGLLRIAGQADLIIKSGNDIIIVDHKTSKKIEQKGFYDNKIKSNEKLLYPLNHLDACNFYEYSLQLSTYAWMLQKINPDFVIKDLILNHYDHEGNNVLYHCPYLKKEVEAMLKDYKKKMIKEKQRERYKPIEY